MVIHFIFQVMTIGRYQVGLASKVCPIMDHLAEVGHDIDGELGDAIEAETCHLVTNGTVAEAFNQCLFIQSKVGIARSRYIRCNIYIHECPHQLMDALIPHSLIHLAVSTQEGGIRQQGM